MNFQTIIHCSLPFLRGFFSSCVLAISSANFICSVGVRRPFAFLICRALIAEACSFRARLNWKGSVLPLHWASKAMVPSYYACPKIGAGTHLSSFMFWDNVVIVLIGLPLGLVDELASRPWSFPPLFLLCFFSSEDTKDDCGEIWLWRCFTGLERILVFCAFNKDTQSCCTGARCDGQNEEGHDVHCSLRIRTERE